MYEVTPNQLKRKRTSSSSDVDDEEKNDVSTSSSESGDDEQRLRRRVFELSLAKVRTAAPLSRSLRRREPPLLRSVLILNTLRAVDAAGILSDADPTLSAAAVAPSTPFRSPSVLDELPGSLLLGDGWPLATASCLTDVVEHSDAPTDTRPADDATTSSILDDLFGCERTSGAFPSLPILTFSSLFDFDCSSVWPSTPATFSSSSSSPSSSTDVDLDLDVAMFDFDLLHPLTTTAAGFAGSRTALPTPACSTGASGGGGILSTSTCTQRNQVFLDELECLEQILVGT